ncbi:MAG: iron chelate uptake ABC transporter family permease subunit [Pseudomonadota bacterium]
MPSKSDRYPAVRAAGFGTLLLLLMSGLSISIGAIEFGAQDWFILTTSRIPRTLSTILAGASLAVAGVVIQQMVHNRFVEPSMTGSTEAAVLGLVLITIAVPEAPILTKMIVAASAALLGTGLFLAMVRRLPVHDPLLVPLVGLIYGGIIGAVAMWIAWGYDMLQLVGAWLLGDMSGVLSGRYELLWLGGAAAALTYLVADQLTIIGMGATRALSLGVNLAMLSILGLAAVSVTSAVVVVTVGAIPFVGLVVPNIVSRLYGDNLRTTLPLVGVLGATVVLGADIVGRLLRYPFEIPAATIVGIVGAALFLWFLLSPKTNE